MQSAQCLFEPDLDKKKSALRNIPRSQERELGHPERGGRNEISRTREISYYRRPELLLRELFLQRRCRERGLLARCPGASAMKQSRRQALPACLSLYR